MNINSHKKMGEIDFPIGAEWDVGYSPPGVYPPLRWTVIRTPRCFQVVSHDLRRGTDTILGTFPSTESGELAAKNFGLKIHREYWDKPI